MQHYQPEDDHGYEDEPEAGLLLHCERCQTEYVDTEEAGCPVCGATAASYAEWEGAKMRPILLSAW